ncbi:putative Mg2+ transporter-C (MgtC) family protein [Microbacterium natoriense]|uniref:Mg2+ transporter-C (MgtC) family protein n=1 Tax=Microbacterium natoriense TaxID=284570 RepID=A0AAW8EWN2_9MICO|nr:MgtC/SapB family protein [Microbacterium natoriense]MDQ0647039.1 putative Mg2+ transporter-C (MgtC) family protein [Microbacterium natoriense]
MQWFSPTLATQLATLALAFVLCTIIGYERQRRQKSAGLRTHALVGMGSALFTIVSAYGFDPALNADGRLDPSRIAAQIVSGIGFLGGGVIFVKRGSVSGLTTAASIWISAAVGMACGAGMPTVAIFATVLDLLAMYVLTIWGRRVSLARDDEGIVAVVYRGGRGILRVLLEQAAASGYDVRLESSQDVTKSDGKPRVEVRIRVVGRGKSIEPLLERIMGMRGVASVRTVAEED